MTTWVDPAVDNLDPLVKQMYADQIAIGYESKGTLKNFVTNQTGAVGISKEFPLLGIQKATERVSDEVIQPNQPVTSNAKMTFKNFEASSSLPKIRQYEINNPSYIPTLVNRQLNAIVARHEQQIINALLEPVTIKAADQNPENIVKALQIMGDGTSRAGNNLAAGDLKPFSVDALFEIKVLFDQMGVADGERYIYLPSGAIKVLLKDELFSNTQYVPSGTAPLENSGIMYSYMGLTIITAQMNPNGGLPISSIGDNKYTTGFAFTRDAVINETDSANPVGRTWWDDQRYSTLFAANIRSGSAVVSPAKTIQIVTTSIF